MDTYIIHTIPALRINTYINFQHDSVNIYIKTSFAEREAHTERENAQQNLDFYDIFACRLEYFQQPKRTSKVLTIISNSYPIKQLIVIM